MSKEGPKAPLWPEGISKVRSVENQRREALPKGVPAPVAKQPELNKPVEQLWQPVKPKDQEKIDAFINDLAQNKEEVLARLQTSLHKPNMTGDEMALAIYLDVAIKRDVFGTDPFASKQPGDEEQQEYREYIADMATEHVAKTWLKEHPDSELASIISDATIYAPDKIHRAFLYEMWSSVYPKITGKD
jgi:hypothetical protein